MKRKLISLLSVILSVILTLACFASCGAAPGNEYNGGAEGGDGNNVTGDNANGTPYDPNSPSFDAPPSQDNESMSPPMGDDEGEAGNPPDFGTDDTPLPVIPENDFVLTSQNNVSTFSADVDTASYTYFRKLVHAGYSFEELRYSAEAFRIEEFINYFKYETVSPEAAELFGVKSSIRPTPWNAETQLLTVTLKAADAQPTTGNNLVFLIDVSGSMMSSDKLPLLKTAFTYLTDNLTEQDTISIVTYSGKEEVVLKGCSGAKKETILNAINSLIARGSTYGEAGLRRAYEIAAEYMIEGGNNRIIMASDGDLNVGITSQKELKTYISGEREKGIYLSILGFGTGNYRDATMETLADNGNGVYYYIDSKSEAERVLGSDLLSTLYTVANDVKLQLTFDADVIESYRLIGYENRRLNNEDFTDDTKDAGEVGSGHCVTVCYELRYKATDADTEDTPRENQITLAVNWKNPGETTSVPPRLYDVSAQNNSAEADDDAIFRECVIQFCMLLRGSKYLPEGSTLEGILEDLQTLDLTAYSDRAEFVSLVTMLTTK